MLIRLQYGPCHSPPGILTSSVTGNGLTVHPESLLCIQFSHRGPHFIFPGTPRPPIQRFQKSSWWLQPDRQASLMLSFPDLVFP